MAYMTLRNTGGGRSVDVLMGGDVTHPDLGGKWHPLSPRVLAGDRQVVYICLVVRLVTPGLCTPLALSHSGEGRVAQG